MQESIGILLNLSKMILGPLVHQLFIGIGVAGVLRLLAILACLSSAGSTAECWRVLVYDLLVPCIFGRLLNCAVLEIVMEEHAGIGGGRGGTDIAFEFYFLFYIVF